MTVGIETYTSPLRRYKSPDIEAITTAATQEMRNIADPFDHTRKVLQDCLMLISSLRHDNKDLINALKAYGEKNAS